MQTTAIVRKMLPALACVLLAGAAQAEVKVTISQSHLCCPACFKAVDETLKDMEGVQHQTDKQAKTITITGQDASAVQRAIDALAQAGFHGKTDNEQCTFKKVQAPAGKVQRLEVSGVHNCCGACTTAIKKVLGGVEGVQANTVKPRAAMFVVEGDFNASEVVDALLAAGFHCQVK